MYRPLIDAASRLGNRPAARLIYLATALQLILSALVFLVDGGLPIWLVAAGWIVLILAVGILALREQQQRKYEAARQRREWKNLQVRKTILQERLSGNPDFQTDCSTCRHRGNAAVPCRVEASASERAFRFHRDDPQCHCLHWDPNGTP